MDLSDAILERLESQDYGHIPPWALVSELRLIHKISADSGSIDAAMTQLAMSGKVEFVKASPGFESGWKIVRKKAQPVSKQGSLF